MKLAAITLESFFDGEAKALNLLFAEGLQLLHLRKPNSDREQMIQLLEAIEKPFCQYIVLHDHFELAKTFSLKGIHLNRRNHAIPVNFQGSISRSCHSLEELKQYPEYNYLFLSPIFDSVSKIGYRAAFSEVTLNEAHQNGIINERIFALGGIDAGNISKIKEYGFGGTAVLGALWDNFTTDSDEEKLRARFRQLKEKTDEKYQATIYYPSNGTV